MSDSEVATKTSNKFGGVEGYNNLQQLFNKVIICTKFKFKCYKSIINGCG